jgi:hypothetical protein
MDRAGCRFLDLMQTCGIYMEWKMEVAIWNWRRTGEANQIWKSNETVYSPSAKVHGQIFAR